MKFLNFLLFLFIFLACIYHVEMNVVMRPKYKETFPGLEGHATIVVKSNKLHPESYFYSPEPKNVVLVFGGFATFLKKIGEANPIDQKRLFNEIYVMDMESMKLVPFHYNMTNPVFKNQKRPGGRAFFDYALVDEHLIWISGGLKDFYIDNSAYNGLAESCLYGDVWTFNITSGLWEQLLAYEGSEYEECSIAETFESGSTTEIILTNLVFVIVSIITMFLFVNLLCKQ